MTKEEIESYCAVSFGVCVYRKRIKKAQFIVQSIYIYGRKAEKYGVAVDFDPMSMIDEGEGYPYYFKPEPLIKVIDSIELFCGRGIAEWENFTKTGRAPYYDSEEVTNEHHQKSWLVFSTKYEDGKLLFPPGLTIKT